MTEEKPDFKVLGKTSPTAKRAINAEQILNAWIEDARTTMLVPASELTREDNRRVLALIATTKVGYQLADKLLKAYGNFHTQEEVHGWILDAKGEIEQVLDHAMLRGLK